MEDTMRRAALVGLLFCAAGLAATVTARQQGAAPRPAIPDAQRVKDNLYVIAASSPADRSAFTGGNTGVYVADSGVVVVDTKLPGNGPDLLARIRAVTNKPVTTIINTHTHGDHTGSNEGFPTSVEIVAHENTKANMLKMDAFKGDKAQFVPKRTYKDKLSLLSGKDRIDLYYFGPGHTNGDTFIVYTAVRVMQTGDMFAWKDAPFIDRANGASGMEFPKTLAKVLAGIKNVDTVIPGHSPVMPLSNLQEFQRYMTDLVAATESAKKSGKSAADAAASINLTAKYPDYKSERVKAAVEAIYAELDGK
jgi:glyoxylase-like metal-dependent hydrolase (beta-lactamase superfamily II)